MEKETRFKKDNVESHKEMVLDANASGTRMRCWIDMNPNRKLLPMSIRHPQNVMSILKAGNRMATAAKEGLMHGNLQSGLQERQPMAICFLPGESQC